MINKCLNWMELNSHTASLNPHLRPGRAGGATLGFAGGATLGFAGGTSFDFSISASSFDSNG